MSRLLRPIPITLAALILATGLIGVLGFRRWQAVAYLQSQFGRSWEISYNINGSPAVLPTFLKERAEDYFWRKYGSGAYPKNYPELLVDRFESLFIGRIKAIDIWYPESIGNDLGGALKRFPSLEALWIGDEAPPTDEVEKLAETLTNLSLKRLALDGFHTLNPDAIEILSRSKSLRELRISEAEIKPESMAVLARWGPLEKLVLDNCRYDPQALERLKQERPGLLATESNESGFCPIR